MWYTLWYYKLSLPIEFSNSIFKRYFIKIFSFYKMQDLVLNSVSFSYLIALILYEKYASITYSIMLQYFRCSINWFIRDKTFTGIVKNLKLQLLEGKKLEHKCNVLVKITLFRNTIHTLPRFYYCSSNVKN